MPRHIYVNLPVENLDKSIEFFTEVGFRFDEKMTDEKATCMIVNDQAYVMLLVRDFFQQFTKKSIADTSSSTEAILAIGADSRDDVDKLVDAALAAGASEANQPMTDPMYGRSFYDLDCHLWEIFWMDEAALQ